MEFKDCDLVKQLRLPTEPYQLPAQQSSPEPMLCMLSNLSMSASKCVFRAQPNSAVKQYLAQVVLSAGAVTLLIDALASVSMLPDVHWLNFGV